MEAHMERQGQSLPIYVQREFDDYLECDRLDRGFLRERCEDCHHERWLSVVKGVDLSQLWCQTHDRERRAVGR